MLDLLKVVRPKMEGKHDCFVKNANLRLLDFYPLPERKPTILEDYIQKFREKKV